MKNNFFLIFLISLFILFINFSAFTTEQFNFDVTELSITENGNKFKGFKKGTVTTNNGVIINAEEFEYDKNSNILNAKGNVKVIDSLKDFTIDAE